MRSNLATENNVPYGENPEWINERASILTGAQAMHRDGLVTSISGNVSHRIPAPDKDLLAITASGKPYPEMLIEDIVVIDFEGGPVLGDAIPSTETMMHVAVYQARSDVHAVVHTHSVYASSLAVAGIPLPPLIDEMVMMIGESVEVASYGFPSTEELGANVVAALGQRKAVLMRNHGVVGVGRTVAEALRVCELVERLSHIYVIATQLGAAYSLPSDIVKLETELFYMRHSAQA